MNIGAFLVAMVGPLTARWLASMGLTVVVMAGLTTAVSTLRGMMMTNLQGLPADGLMLAGLLGIWESIGIILGALTFCVTWISTKGFWSLAKT